MLAIAAALLATAAAAVPGKTAALGGISGFTVSVHGIDDDATGAGLSEEAVKAQAERVLRAGGVPVLEASDVAAEPGVAGNLAVSIWITGDDPHGAALVSVYRPVRFGRDDKSSAAVWAYGQVLSPRRAIGGPTWEEKLDKPLKAFVQAWQGARKAWLASLPDDAFLAGRSASKGPGDRAGPASCREIRTLRRGMTQAQAVALFGEPLRRHVAACDPTEENLFTPCMVEVYACTGFPGPPVPLEITLVDGKVRGWYAIFKADQ